MSLEVRTWMGGKRWEGLFGLDILVFLVWWIVVMYHFDKFLKAIKDVCARLFRYIPISSASLVD